jgi:hypothetical protein
LVKKHGVSFHEGADHVQGGGDEALTTRESERQSIISSRTDYSVNSNKSISERDTAEIQSKVINKVLEKPASVSM